VIAAFRQQHPSAPTAALCAALGVSRSWFYERPTAQEPTIEDVELRDAIERIALEFPGYGYRRVVAQLARDGWTGERAANHKRVLRVMRQGSLLCRLQKRFAVTTDSNHAHRCCPNLLKGTQLIRPDQAWVADITYIRLPGGFCYLAAILDAFSRRCVGWHLSRDIDTTLTLAVLEIALTARRPSAGLIHHSDRGVQYASADYVSRLERAEALASMSGRGNPYDNAKVESFFKTLKTEEVHLKDYQNFTEARSNVGPFIEAVYNHKRLHSSLGYRPPAEFEEVFRLNAEQPTKLA
jgi:transposase InsO family protein